LAANEIQHPIFARVYQRISGLMEHDLAGYREELLAGLSGRILEVGAGNGMNFRHYPGAVSEVVAVEPEPYLRARAEEAAAPAPIRVRVCAGVAGELPIEAGSVDATVSCLVLCSVPDQPAALEEIRRVLKPGGELRFLEHVRAAGGRKARVQQGVDRLGLWPRIAGGCHCARDTVAAIEAAGFAISEVRDFELGPSLMLTNPHLLGIARPSS
jgi:SAM-dependent methyltransferase